MPALALAKLWKPLSIAALIVAVSAYRGVLIHQRDTARAQAAKLSARVADLEAGNRALSSAIAAQNAAIAELRKKADAAASLARTREDAQARAGAQAMAAAAHRAVALAHAPVEPGCAAAIRWGNEQAAELGRW